MEQQPYEKLQRVRSIDWLINDEKKKLEEEEEVFKKRLEASEKLSEWEKKELLKKWKEFRKERESWLEELRRLREQLLAELAELGISPEIQEQLRAESLERLAKFLADYRIAGRLKRISQHGIKISRATGLDDFANFLEEENDELDNSIKKRARESPEAFLAFHLLRLREYRKSLERGELVRTPWVEEKIKEIINYLRMGQPVFLYGETGSGKTELAKFIAQHYSNGFEIVRGHRFMTREDLFGYLGLKATEPPPPEKVPALIKEAMKKVKEENPDMTDKELKDDKSIIERVIIGQASDPVTVTEFYWGPVYRAMSEGKILIIDEANYIPPGLLSSLNEILSGARPGIEFKITETGQVVKIKEGFGVILTGNINKEKEEKYLERYKLDPALRDRVKLIKYNTPPQENRSKIGPYSQLETGETPERDLFLIAVATLIDRRGNLTLPNGEAGLKQVWQLCQAFKLFQDIFAGEPVGGEYQFVQGSSSLSLKITQNNLSMRKLINILTRWRRDGFSRSLDYYIWDEVIKQALSTPQEAAYFYQIFQKIYGFFQDEKTWDQSPDYGSGGVVVFNYNHPGQIDQKIPRSQRNILLVDVIKLVEAVSGEKMPSLEIVIDKEEEEKKRNLTEFQARLEGFEGKWEEQLKELITYCPPEDYKEHIPNDIQEKL